LTSATVVGPRPQSGSMVSSGAPGVTRDSFDSGWARVPSAPSGCDPSRFWGPADPLGRRGGRGRPSAARSRWRMRARKPSITRRRRRGGDGVEGEGGRSTPSRWGTRRIPSRQERETLPTATSGRTGSDDPGSVRASRRLSSGGGDRGMSGTTWRTGNALRKLETGRLVPKFEFRSIAWLATRQEQKKNMSQPEDRRSRRPSRASPFVPDAATPRIFRDPFPTPDRKSRKFQRIRRFRDRAVVASAPRRQQDAHNLAAAEES
jgi:hypothetical protein